METHAATLEALATRLKGVVKDPELAARHVPAERRDAVRAVGLAATALSNAQQGTKAEASAAQGHLAARDNSIDSLRQVSAPVATALNERVARLIPFIQFADGLNQRLEHALRLMGRIGRPNVGSPSSGHVDHRGPSCRVGQRSDAGAKPPRRGVLADLEETASNRTATLLSWDDTGIRRWIEADAAVTDHLAAGTQVAQAEVEEARTRLDAMMVAAQGASSAIAHLKGLVDELNVAACNAPIASARAANRAGLANDAFGLLSGWTGCEQTLTNHPDWFVKIEQVAERTGEMIELAPGGGGESHNLWRYPL